MKSLIVGMGFGNLYKDIYTKLGHEISTVDIDPIKNATYKTIIEAIKNKPRYDTVHICSPNFLHTEHAEAIAPYAKIMFIEKPGLKNYQAWWNLVDSIPKTRVMMVKNNQWRSNIKLMLKLLKNSSEVRVNWINKNRVPQPGSWFTDKSKAYGGVSRDLLPHLLSIYTALDPNYVNMKFSHMTKYQRWQLSDLTNSGYGKVITDGIYDVDDYVTLIGVDASRRNWTFTADWRSNVDEDIAIHFDNETVPLGLCPEDAYERMIIDAIANVNNNDFWKNQCEQDFWIHQTIEQI